MRIFKFKKDLHTNLGNHKIGERVFEGEEAIPLEYEVYYPENGGYPLKENSWFKFVDEYLEFVGETDKPKEYFIEKVYTQEQMDNALKAAQ